MKNNREYIYSFPNTSCTLRIVEYLQKKERYYLDSVVVINLVDRWLVKLSLKNSTPHRLVKNIQAFFNEMGSVCKPSIEILEAIASLERGQSPTDVMNRYRVVVVAYGKPETEEIKVFRDCIVKRLGYCPRNMA